jgi:hypothetical protein
MRVRTGLTAMIKTGAPTRPAGRQPAGMTGERT